MSSVAVVIATAPLEDSTGPLPHRLRAEADGRCHRPMLRRLIAARAASPGHPGSEFAPHDDIGSDSDCARNDTRSQTFAGTGP